MVFRHSQWVLPSVFLSHSMKCFHCRYSRRAGVNPLELLREYKGAEIAILVTDLPEAKQTRCLSTQLHLCHCCRALWERADRSNFCALLFSLFHKTRWSVFTVIVLLPVALIPSPSCSPTEERSSPSSCSIAKKPSRLASCPTNSTCVYVVKPCSIAPTKHPFSPVYSFIECRAFIVASLVGTSELPSSKYALTRDSPSP